ncbi:MAG: hypothetical protein NVV83_19420 [Afipia sp.]|uniref:Uncharacterized protein n=1 Tax=Afipia massiliensis TaxID=211460 RepID=A0A840MTV2_9BRAD|nr:hypothetical protein [Afipia massiliensis]MBB5051819.1 hypothetical protein [Afipia massiliensis]MCR6736116.1 hypothetical protein [Afipia sp.]
MAHLPSLPAKATLLDVFKTFPETNRSPLEFTMRYCTGIAIH